MALIAYGCGFDFRMSSVTYMLYLIYFRAGRCYSEVNWSVLDGLNRNVTLQPDMPTETDAVFRTSIFSIVYLILSIFLVITTLLACCESSGWERNVRLLIDFFIYSRHTTHRQIKAPDFLFVLCTISRDFRVHYHFGSGDIGILSFRLLFITWSKRTHETHGDQKHGRDVANS